jgi:hypothetical protein
VNTGPVTFLPSFLPSFEVPQGCYTTTNFTAGTVLGTYGVQNVMCTVLPRQGNGRAAKQDKPFPQARAGYNKGDI